METADKGGKDKYLHPCLERRHNFTPMVYSTDRIPGTEAFASQKNLALLLDNKLKREYLEICGFVRYRVSLTVVRPNTLLLRDARYNEAYIRQRPDMKDGAVMALLALWRVQKSKGLKSLEAGTSDE